MNTVYDLKVQETKETKDADVKLVQPSKKMKSFSLKVA